MYRVMSSGSGWKNQPMCACHAPRNMPSSTPAPWWCGVVRVFRLVASWSSAVRAWRWATAHAPGPTASSRGGDKPEDPHTPHHHGAGVLGMVARARGTRTSLVLPTRPGGHEPGTSRTSSRAGPLRVADALFPLWVVLGLLIPAALGGIISGTWAGVWTGLVWGGLVRVFVVHHVTWRH